MPKRRKDHAVRPQDHQAIIEALQQRLLPGYRLLRLGNAAVQAWRVEAIATRDFDASVHQAKGDQPSWDELLSIARAVDPNCDPANDRSVILLHVKTPSGVAEVDLIRGRRRPGRFLTQDFLEAVAQNAVELPDQTLLAPTEALAVMKAWAAHDQGQRHRTAKHDQYLLDLDGLRAAQVATGNAFDQNLLQKLLELVRPSRSRSAVQTLLVEHGVLV